MNPSASLGKLKKLDKLSKFGELIDSLTLFDWLGIALAIILLFVVIYLIWRRKHPKEDSKAMAVPEMPVFPSNRLSKVWDSFISATPWRLRSDIRTVPFSLVIGNAGCGKTEIIDKYANWRGQDFHFHPSAVDDPLLQIYQGSKALVLEFSSSLLYDTNPAIYRAMKKLWKNLPTNPQAVIVIDASTLLKPEPEQLRLSGQALIGKLKVFKKLEGKALPVTLSLSHMEKVAGFVEFCAFLKEVNIPLQIEFPKMEGINHLETCLDGFEQHLRRALMSCSSQDYLKIVAFLDEAPRLLKILSEFLHLAGLEEDAGSVPIVRLCLLSKETTTLGCQPFARQPSFVAQSAFKLDFHAKTALIILLLGFGYLGGSYYYQKSLLKEVIKNIKTVGTTPIERYPEEVSPLFLDFSADLNKNPFLTFQPNFFPKILEFTHLLLIREIREYYLIPMVAAAQFESDSIFKTIKLLAILYGEPDNAMGEMVLRQLNEKPTDYMVKHRLLISEYIEYNSRPKDLARPLNALNYTLTKTYDDKTDYVLSLLQKFNIILEKQFIERSEIDTVAQHSTTFLRFIDELNSHSNEIMMMSWLQKNARGLAINLQHYHDSQIALKQKPMEQLLRLISNFNLSDDDTTCPSTTSIILCLKKAQAIAEVEVDASLATMDFTLAGNNFSYISSQWDELIRRYQVAWILRKTVQNHKKNSVWSFFDASSVYPDLEMNATNNGETLFAGKANIDGRLTAEAFEKEVKPAVVALSEIVDKLPINSIEKKQFKRFVLNNLRIYSSRYVNAYLNYFQKFQVRIDSVWALNYVLDQIQQPNSPLLQTLVEIKTNTELNLTSLPNFQAFAQRLTLFNFVKQLMQEKDGMYPEFQKYQFIMGQMQAELNSLEPYLPKETDGNAAALKGAITPMGRVAWGMLLREEGAYSTLINNWLQNAGVPKRFQQPFFAPIQKVKTLGAVEVQTTIDGLWADIWDSNIAPLLVKFPFTPSAGKNKELSIEELNKTFHPKQGAFWLTFQQYLTPLYKFNNGVWVKRHHRLDSIKLPEKLLTRVNAAQQITDNLWDDLGEAKPLKLSIKAGLLPTFDDKKIPNAPIASLNYLREGGVSILGFNQQPVWQKLELEWWTPQAAEVGMEFRKDESPTRMHTNITVDDSQWNLFRLLRQGESLGNNQYQWLLAHPNLPQQPLALKFSFQSAPWAIFTNLAGS